MRAVLEEAVRPVYGRNGDPSALQAAHAYAKLIEGCYKPSLNWYGQEP